MKSLTAPGAIFLPGAAIRGKTPPGLCYTRETCPASMPDSGQFHEITMWRPKIGVAPGRVNDAFAAGCAAPVHAVHQVLSRISIARRSPEVPFVAIQGQVDTLVLRATTERRIGRRASCPVW